MRLAALRFRSLASDVRSHGGFHALQLDAAQPAARSFPALRESVLALLAAVEKPSPKRLLSRRQAQKLPPKSLVPPRALDHTLISRLLFSIVSDDDAFSFIQVLERWNQRNLNGPWNPESDGILVVQHMIQAGTLDALMSVLRNPLKYRCLPKKEQIDELVKAWAARATASTNPSDSLSKDQDGSDNIATKASTATHTEDARKEAAENMYKAYLLYDFYQLDGPGVEVLESMSTAAAAFPMEGVDIQSEIARVA
ncbi:MAG: hypothetical protein SGCHY_005510 [Lobulomycetales sp.]